MLLGNKDMLSDGNQNVWGGDGGDDSLKKIINHLVKFAGVLLIYF